MAQLGAGKRLLVLGGGLSGLAYVHYLRNFLAFRNKTNLISKILLIEAGDYMGGSVKTNVFDDGVVHELGPRSVRVAGAKGQNTGALIEHLGLEDQLVTVTSKSSAGKERYIYRNGGLHIVPGTLTRLFTRLPGSKATLFGVLKKDWFAPKMDLDKYPDNDPSLYDFVTYRFGEEAAEAVLDPLLRGITAGKARELSTKALMNDLLLKEQAYGSILRGQFKAPTTKMEHDELFPQDILKSKVLDKFQKENVLSFNLKTGLQTLPEHLCNSLLNTNEDGVVAIYNKTKVKSISFNNKNLEEAPCSVTVQTVDGDHLAIEADHVISTIPANNFNQILPDSMPAEQKQVLKRISQITHAPVGTVVLEYRDVQQDLPKVVNSFGFLTHSEAGSKVLGIAFDSTMFPDIDKATNSFRMTAMMGGAWYKDVFGTDNLEQISETQLEQIALEEVEKILNFRVEPHRVSAYLWKTGIAQYKPGHVGQVQDIRNSIAKLKLPLTLLGQSFDGVAVNDVIYSSRMAADKFVKSL